MRSWALAVVALLALASPAAAARCPKTSAGPPLQAIRAIAGHVDAPAGVVTAVYVCDRRRGREWRFARARLKHRDGRPATGSLVLHLAAAGRRVAWTSKRSDRRRTSVTLTEVIVGRRARIVTRRVLFAGKRGAPDATVAVTPRGDLAWEGAHIVLRPAGRRARVVGDGYGVAFEDDRTLRWHGEKGLAYRDVRPPRIRDGCPYRERFKPIAQTAVVLVTLARYEDADYSEQSTVRVCLRGAGDDRVVGYEQADDSGGGMLSVAGIGGPWVVLVDRRSTRYDAMMDLWTVHAGTGAVARSVWRTGFRKDRYEPDPNAAVVTERGVPVWISTYDFPESGPPVASLVTGTGYNLVVLDSGPPGSLTDLRADGPRVTWMHAGEPRGAEPA